MADKIKISMADGYYVPSTVLWLLAEDLTIRQAALLLLNEDPERFPLAEYPSIGEHIPPGYEAARQVIVSALLANKIDGKVEWKTKTSGNPDEINYWEENVEGDVCADKATINMDSLRAWLASKNVTVEQFIGLSGTSDDFLDQNDQKYAPKLAAAVAAWRYVKNNPINGLSVKQQLMNWLNENSARFWPDGMDAKVTDTFVKEAARIANWDAEGGRPPIAENKVEEKTASIPPPVRKPTKTVPPPPVQPKTLALIWMMKFHSNKSGLFDNRRLLKAAMN